MNHQITPQVVGMAVLSKGRAWLISVARWWANRFRPRQPTIHDEEPLVLDELAPPLAPVAIEQAKAKRAPRVAEDTYGAFHFREDILDQLDDYFRVLERLKKHDREAYAYHAKVGGILLSGRGKIEHGSLPTTWRDDPRYGNFHGLVFLPRQDKEDPDRIPARAIYVQRFKKLERVEQARGRIYSVSLFYDDDRAGKAVSCVADFAITVADDLTVRALRVRQPVLQHIEGGSKRYSGTITHHVWRLPTVLSSLSQDAKGWGATPNEFARNIFTFVMQSLEFSDAGVMVRVTRGGLTAAFSIPMTRAPYFFRDRDKDLTATGSTKRVFHSTRPHTRTRKDGSTSTVKFHFRGQREFMWHGSKVHITVPGWHHADFKRFNAAGVEADDNDPLQAGMIDTAQVAQKIDRHYRQEAWRQ